MYGATLTPFGGNASYDDPDGHREAARQQVNEWIRTSGTFDAVIDLDRAARDPAAPRNLLPAYDVGDHLHLNPAGYKALAEAVPPGCCAACRIRARVSIRAAETPESGFGAHRISRSG